MSPESRKPKAMKLIHTERRHNIFQYSGIKVLFSIKSGNMRLALNIPKLAISGITLTHKMWPKTSQYLTN